MNTFEVAVLRVLIKRQQPLKLSALVDGFPDDCEDNVLSAVSSLRLQGYLVLDDYQPNGYVSINKARRKEILQIVDPDIHPHGFESLNVGEKDDGSSISTPAKNSPHQVTARHRILPGIRTIAFSSLLIVGLISAIGMSLPTATSPDSDFVAHHEYTAYKKWSGGVHRADAHEGGKISSAPYPATSPSFVGLKDCNQGPLHEQQT